MTDTVRVAPKSGTAHRHTPPTSCAGQSQIDQPARNGAGLWAQRCDSRWNKPDVVVLLSPALFSSIVVALKAALSRRPVVVWVQDIYSLGAAEAGQAGALQSRAPGRSRTFTVEPSTGRWSSSMNDSSAQW